MEIEDDFLDHNVFDKFQAIMMGSEFSWKYTPIIDYEDEDKFQFIHGFYFNPLPRSSYFEILEPILVKIDPISLWRAKANLITKTPNIVENSYHIDMLFLKSEKKIKQWTTSIFYINTNNGYTEFEDGTQVESVANRLVTFPANLKHTGTSCTDKKIRVVINFNYFSGKEP